MKLSKFSLRKLYRKLYLQERTSILQDGDRIQPALSICRANQPWIDSGWLNTGMWNVWICRAGPRYLTTLYKALESKDSGIHGGLGTNYCRYWGRLHYGFIRIKCNSERGNACYIKKRFYTLKKYNLQCTWYHAKYILCIISLNSTSWDGKYYYYLYFINEVAGF